MSLLRSSSPSEPYDGALDILDAWRRGLAPELQLTVTEWADKYRRLSQKGAAEPGRWRTSRTPYLAGIMEALSPSSPVQRVVFMKGAQIGGTEAGNNWLGHVVDHSPGPMLLVWPSEAVARRNSRQRLTPLIEETPRLLEKIKPARSRDSGNSTLMKEFPGGFLAIAGANAPANLRSMPVRFLFLDEADAYPGEVGNEGDPVALAEERTETFSRRRKVYIVSTPLIQGLSRVEGEFEASDQRYYFVPCPHCQHKQHLIFENLRWEQGKPSTVAYVCESCQQPIREHHKTWMLKNGEWRATKQGDGITAGFHLSQLYSPRGWTSWEKIARRWERDKDDPETLKVFKNNVLGLPWAEDAEAPEPDRLYERREAYPRGVVPRGGLRLTAGVDIQRDRIEVEVVAWGRGLESWSVEYFVFPGDPSRDDLWRNLEELLHQPWPHEAGGELRIGCMAVDAGYETQTVYGWRRRIADDRVIVIQGRDRLPQPLGRPTWVDVTVHGKKLRRGAQLWPVGVSFLKQELYGWLRLPVPEDGEPSPRYCHFPAYDLEHFKQLVAEQRVVKRGRGGYPKVEWIKAYHRNERLDCRVYARAAAARLQLDRFRDRHWSEAERQLGIKSSTLEPPPPGRDQPAAPQPPQPPKPPSPASGARRVIRRIR